VGNRTPNLLEILHGREALRREWVALGGPRAIVCVGSTAHQALHPVSIMSLSSCLGKPVFKDTRYGRVWFISQYHPAYGLRNRHNLDLLARIERDWEDMGKFLREEEIL
jgi:uracil-DNA glycosylase family 4